MTTDVKLQWQGQQTYTGASEGDDRQSKMTTDMYGKGESNTRQSGNDKWHGQCSHKRHELVFK